jgi:hypothetical protein
MSSTTIDLTIDTPAVASPAQVAANVNNKKRKAESIMVSPEQQLSTLTSLTTATSSKPAKAAKVPKKELPHVLIWVGHNGPGQSRKWTNKNLKIIGVYGSKEEAEQKKEELCNQYEQCGYGDILVGGTWEDEIDLVVRPAGECTL